MSTTADVITAAGFVGPVTGALTGNVTGNLTGNSTGTHTGPQSGKNTAGVQVSSGAAATLTTASNQTLTAAQLMSGLLLRDPNGGARSDTTPTAALLAAALPAGVAVAGDSFAFEICNTADAAEQITILAGSGCTLSGTMTIDQNKGRRFRAEFTAANAYTLYSLGDYTF